MTRLKGRSPDTPNGGIEASNQDRLGLLIRTEDNLAETETQATHEVYNGLQHVGMYRICNRERCEAYDARGEAIGVFPDPLKAVSAICGAARERKVVAS